MAKVGLSEAREHLSELLDRVERGEEVVIERGGKPAAKMVSVGRGAAPEGPVDRSGIFGCMAGKGRVADDFDAPLPQEIQRYFDGYDEDDAPR
jgi:prevent-host-death family protein